MADTTGSGPSAETLTSSGIAWIKKNDPDRAIADFTRAIQIDPKNAKAYRLRGTAYGRKREFDKAIADIDQAVALTPNDAATYYLRGRIWHLSGDRGRAIADYERAIRLDPDHLKAFQALETAVHEVGGQTHSGADEAAPVFSRSSAKTTVRTSGGVGQTVPLTPRHESQSRTATAAPPERKTSSLLWRTLRFVGGGLVTILFGVRFVIFAFDSNGGNLGLDVTATADGAFNEVVIINTSSKTTTIKEISVNGRSDCNQNKSWIGVVSGAFMLDLPKELKTGDRTGVLTECEVVNVTVKSDKGTDTFTFR